MSLKDHVCHLPYLVAKINCGPNKRCMLFIAPDGRKNKSTGLGTNFYEQLKMTIVMFTSIQGPVEQSPELCPK